jgi:hypothetical protein
MLLHHLDSGRSWTEAIRRRLKRETRSEGVVSRAKLYEYGRFESKQEAKKPGVTGKAPSIVRWRQFTTTTRGDFEYILI